MAWIVIAIGSYFLVAFQIILDKFLLTSRRIAHPATYAFYSGLLSLVTLAIFFPFGFHLVNPATAIWYLLAGAVFIYGVLSLFFALKVGEASQVTPVIGAVIPIVTYFLSFIFSSEKLSVLQMIGIIILIFGGLLISFDLPLKLNKKKFFAGFYHSILAGVLLAAAFFVFDDFYKRDSFVNVFIWTRLGLFAGALTLLLLPFWRRLIWTSLVKFRKPERENTRTGMLFIFNKILGGTGSALTNYAIALGSVTVVNALVSVEYIFVFLLSLIFSLWLPKIFAEKGKFWDIAQKVGAIFIIAIGILLISLK